MEESTVWYLILLVTREVSALAYRDSSFPVMQKYGHFKWGKPAIASLHCKQKSRTRSYSCAA